MRILITRPDPDAGPLAKALALRGHETLIMSLLDICFRDFTIDPSRFRAVLATSANGVRALARLSNFADIKTLRLYAVGPATAAEARRAGFARIETAGGDVIKLGRYVAERLEPVGAPLLHVSGKAAAGDLQGLLGGLGYKVERIIGYEAQKAAAFAPEILDRFRIGEIDAVLLYSPRTAAIFSDLVQRADLESALSGVLLLCLSTAVGAKLADLQAGAIHVAKSADQEALLDLVERCSQNR